MTSLRHHIVPALFTCFCAGNTAATEAASRTTDETDRVEARPEDAPADFNRPASSPPSAPVNAAPSPETGPGTVDAVSFNRQIDRALAALSHEPSLAALKAAALQHADLGRTETDGWKRAANLQALLPILKVTADLGVGRDEALDRYQDKPDRWGADTDQGYGVGLQAQWKLGALVFNADELKVYDMLSDRAVRREALLSTLVSLYFERRRLQLTAMLAPPEGASEIVSNRMRLGELTATIDALTGGLLSRRLSQKDHGR
jgi:hypothetical protein